MSPLEEAPPAASAAGGPGGASSSSVPSANANVEDVPMQAAVKGDAGSSSRDNVNPDVNGRLKRSLEDYEPVVVKTLANPELPTQAD